MSVEYPTIFPLSAKDRTLFFDPDQRTWRLMPSKYCFGAGPYNGKSGMEQLSSDEVRELLVGTWTGIALLIESLVQARAVERGDLVLPLSQAEALAKDRRRIALTALRKLIEDGFGEADRQQAA
jgi:hypothetical protein